MKKLYTIIFLVIFMFLLITKFSFIKNNNTLSTYKETNNIVSLYKIDFNKSITLKKYKEMFSTLNGKEYKIKDFVLDLNYNDVITEKINEIKVSNDNYLIALDQYLTKCIKLLSDYNIDFYIDTNIKIKSVTILTSNTNIHHFEIANNLNNDINFNITNVN